MDLSDLKTYQCPSCDADLEIKETPDGPHYAQAVCSSSGRFVDWIRDPGKPVPRIKRSSADRALCMAVRENARWCSFCGGRFSRYEAHHSKALCDGGTQADKENLIALCPVCHQLATWRQNDLRQMRRLFKSYKVKKP